MLDIAGELERTIQSLRGKHLTKIGSGLNRQVYRINTNKFGEQYKGKVVKYARQQEMLEDNRKEFSTWMAVKGTTLEQNFCPIRDRSKNFEFLIMDYARPASTIKRIQVEDMQQRLEDNFQLQDNIHDLYDANFGYHDTHGLVVIDYPWGGDFEYQNE